MSANNFFNFGQIHHFFGIFDSLIVKGRSGASISFSTTTLTISIISHGENFSLFCKSQKMIVSCGNLNNIARECLDFSGFLNYLGIYNLVGIIELLFYGPRKYLSFAAKSPNVSLGELNHLYSFFF